MKFLFHIIFLLIGTAPFAQSVPVVELDLRIKRIEAEIFRLEKDLKVKSDSLNILRINLVSLKSNDDGLKTYVYRETDVFLESDRSQLIGKIEKNEVVYVIGYADWWQFMVRTDSIIGFVNVDEVHWTDNIKYFRYSEERKSKEERRKTQENNLRQQALRIQQARLEKRQSLRKELHNRGYSSLDIEKVIAEKVWIGMSDKMAILSWGSPQSINQTMNKYGIKEQWVYENGFLYFENGLLETIQTSN